MDGWCVCVCVCGVCVCVFVCVLLYVYINLIDEQTIGKKQLVLLAF